MKTPEVSVHVWRIHLDLQNDQVSRSQTRATSMAD